MQSNLMIGVKRMNIENRVLPELKSTLAQFPGFQLEENLELGRRMLKTPLLSSQSK